MMPLKRKRLREKLHEINPTCPECGRRTLINPVDIKANVDRMATLDHIMPTSRGGKDVPCNILLMCRKCNNEKGEGDLT